LLLKKRFHFHSAHYLPSYKGKCENMHGHTYKLEITIQGEPDSEGMIMDFADLKKVVNEEVISKLDHTLINDIIPIPSAEYIGVWIYGKIYERLKREYPHITLVSVEVWETETSSVVVFYEDFERYSERIR